MEALTFRYIFDSTPGIRSNMRATLLIRAVLAMAIAIGSSHTYAEVIFHEDNVVTNENLQFNDGLEGGPAETIQGLTNNTGILVNISRIDPLELLVKGAS